MYYKWKCYFFSFWNKKTKLFGIIVSGGRHGKAERSPSLVGLCCCIWGLTVFLLTWSFIECLKEAAETVAKLLHSVPAEKGSSRRCICLFAMLVSKLGK